MPCSYFSRRCLTAPGVIQAFESRCNSHGKAGMSPAYLLARALPWRTRDEWDEIRKLVLGRTSTSKGEGRGSDARPGRLRGIDRLRDCDVRVARGVDRPARALAAGLAHLRSGCGGDARSPIISSRADRSGWRSGGQ